MKRKSIFSVREAVELAYDQMPEVFTMWKFISRVRFITERHYLFDETIKRRLREAREDKPEYNYRCVDIEKSIYKKLANGKIN